MAIGSLRRMPGLLPAARRSVDVITCLDKTRWSTQQAAARALASMRKELPGVFPSTMRPYRCRASGRPHWHWGRSI